MHPGEKFRAIRNIEIFPRHKFEKRGYMGQLARFFLKFIELLLIKKKNYHLVSYYRVACSEAIFSIASFI